MTIDDYMKKIHKNNTSNTKENNYRRSIIKRTLLTSVIVLIILITCNLNSTFKSGVKKYVFEKNYNFAKINSLYKKYLLDITKKTGLEKTAPVNKNFIIEYKEAKDYMNGVELTIEENTNVKLLESGLVVFIGEKEGYGSSIVVQQSNGIDVTYGNITPGSIKIYDYLEKNTIIGIASEKLYLEFTKDGETLDYKTYIK